MERDRMNAEGPGGTANRRLDLERLVSRRVAEYVELWEGAAARFSRSSYRSEHLLDDWFMFWGKAARDMTAGAALLWGAGAGGVPRPSRSPEEHPTRETDER